MFYTIYQVTHIPSGKVYIGKHQTNNIDDGYMGSGKRLKYAQDKHGLDQFQKTVLHIFDNEEDMNAKEAELVTEEFCARKDTYNICPGGKGGWGYVHQQIKHGNLKIPYMLGYINGRKKYNTSRIGSKLDAEVKLKISEALKGRAGNCAMLGKTHSDETKRKMSKSGSGNKNSQYGTMWITNGIESKKIAKDQEIPEGYRRGRKFV